jgi:hypothetical protein
VSAPILSDLRLLHGSRGLSLLHCGSRGLSFLFSLENIVVLDRCRWWCGSGSLPHGLNLIRHQCSAWVQSLVSAGIQEGPRSFSLLIPLSFPVSFSSTFCFHADTDHEQLYIVTSPLSIQLLLPLVSNIMFLHVWSRSIPFSRVI